jgi:polo-like kinase 1
MTSYTLTDYPKELQKKVTLLQHFRSYLEGDTKGKPQTAEAEPEPAQNKSTCPVFVKKWMRTKHAIMFRLSNKIVQVNFEDHTEIILNSESREVTYVNKKGVRASYPLTTALESTNVEMAKRLKYTKDILTHMLASNQQKQEKTGELNANSDKHKQI